MKTKHFIDRIEKAQLVAAIQEAQKDNSGDIILLISQKKVTDAVAAAQASFRRLSLENKKHPNVILIFLAPESQRLAVVGGSEIYKKMPGTWWQEIVREITASFASQQHTEGLLLGIAKIGDALKTHFPTAENVDRSGQSDILEEA